MDQETALLSLRNINETVTDKTLQCLNDIVLSDPDFFTSPGGTVRHHNFKHGLVIHTAEVMMNAFMMSHGRMSDELITAVIWHDYMKTREYGSMTVAGVEGVVEYPYRKKIGHLAGSAMEFHCEARERLRVEVLVHIEHLMLSHHGRRDWGSPVEPSTSEAFILHSADMMSAKGCNL
jgi:3'-5' exoribonuclease